MFGLLCAEDRVEGYRRCDREAEWAHWDFGHREGDAPKPLCSLHKGAVTRRTSPKGRIAPLTEEYADAIKAERAERAAREEERHAARRAENRKRELERQAAFAAFNEQTFIVERKDHSEHSFTDDLDSIPREKVTPMWWCHRPDDDLSGGYSHDRITVSIITDPGYPVLLRVDGDSGGITLSQARALRDALDAAIGTAETTAPLPSKEAAEEAKE